MVSAFTPNKKIEQPAFNDYVNSWDVPVNADWDILDKALGGSSNVNLTGFSGSQLLTIAQFQPLKIIASGAPTAATNLVVPSGVGGLWVVRNNTTGGFVLTISSAAGGALITVPVDTNTLVTCDGTATGMFLAINTAPIAGGLVNQVQFNNAGVLGGSADLTWDGTSLTTKSLIVADNTILGNGAGDTLGINGTALSTPNGLVVNTNQLVLGTDGRVSIGTVTPTAGVTLTVGGSIHSTAGGYYFPDGSLQTSATTVPAGTVTGFAGPNAPAGWLICNGGVYAQATYPALYNAIGGYYNIGGEGAGNFRVPDLRGTVVAGLDQGAGRLTTNTINAPSTWGGRGGQETEQAYADISASGRSHGANYGQHSVHVYMNTGGESAGVGGLQFGGGGYAAQAHVHYMDGWFSTEGSIPVYADGTYYGGGYTRAVSNVQHTLMMFYIIKV